MWEACNTCCKCSSYICIDKSHFCCLIVVLIMHVVNHVKCTNIEVSKPIHHCVILLDNFVIIKVLWCDRCIFRTNLHLCLFINTAVDSVEKALSKVSSCAEELDFLTCLCCGYAAADWVIIAPYRTHHIIVLVLNWACCNWNMRSILLEVLRKSWRIKNCEVWLRWRSHILKCVEETVVVLCNHWTAVNTKTCNFECSPYRVAREELVVRLNSCKLNHTALHNKVVNKFLSLWFCKCTVLKVTLNVDVEECWYTTNAHCSAVLSLDSSKITEVEPLNCLCSVLSRLWNIKAVRKCHFLHIVKSTNLIGDFFTKLEVASSHTLTVCFCKVLFLAFDKTVNTVKSNSSVVTDDSASAVCVGKTCKNLVVTGKLHLRSIDIEYTLVVSLVIFCKDFVEFRAWSVAIHLAWLLSHFNTAVRHKCTLERLVCLKTYNLFKVFIKICSAVSCDAAYNLSFHIKNAALGSFFLLEFLKLAPELVCSFCRTFKERLVAVIRCVVSLNEVSDINVGLPFATCKICPFFSHYCKTSDNDN